MQRYREPYCDIQSTMQSRTAGTFENPGGLRPFKAKFFAYIPTEMGGGGLITPLAPRFRRLCRATFDDEKMTEELSKLGYTTQYSQYRQPRYTWEMDRSLFNVFLWGMRTYRIFLSVTSISSISPEFLESAKSCHLLNKNWTWRPTSFDLTPNWQLLTNKNHFARCY